MTLVFILQSYVTQIYNLMINNLVEKNVFELRYVLELDLIYSDKFKEIFYVWLRLILHNS